MSPDLFEREQKVYDGAVRYIKSASAGVSVDLGQFESLATEYSKMLHCLRRLTAHSDQTTSALHTSNLSLHHKAFFDAATGISNRRHLDKVLKQTLRQASRTESPLSLLMVDIDYFKQYNDSFGHQQGDHCLRLVAQTLQSAVTREGDLVARYGGEEFAVILPNTDGSGASLVAEKLLVRVRNLDIPNPDCETEGPLTISVGAATARVHHKMTGEEFIQCADEALYQSKRRGRNRVTQLYF